MLQEGFYSYEYSDDLKILSKTSLPEKDNFYSHLNMKVITDSDYTRRKRIWKDFKITDLG